MKRKNNKKQEYKVLIRHYFIPKEQGFEPKVINTSSPNTIHYNTMVRGVYKRKNNNQNKTKKKNTKNSKKKGLEKEPVDFSKMNTKLINFPFLVCAQ